MTTPLRLSVRRSPISRSVAERDVWISLTVPSDLEVVEEAVDLVARHCLACGFPPGPTRFNLRVALTEALANAIVYGNNLRADKSVDVQVVVTDASVELLVEDEGHGFDPASVPDPTVPERLERPDGRGLFLIRQLVDDVTFNDRGNCICMILRRA